MSDRLLHICQREEIAKHFEKKHLLELASQSEGDIRSCLNTIQFMSSHMRTNKDANLTSMNKDIKSDFFQTLTSIFVKDEENKNSTRELAEELLGIDMDRTEKLLQGCFENYADIRFNSSGDLQEVLTALEWTQWSDILNLKIRQHQAFGLATYQVFPLLTYHTQCGSMYKNQFHKSGMLTYPRKEGEVRAKITSNKNIVATITPQLALQHHNNGIDIYTDIAPTLVSLLQPSILSGSTGSAGGGRVNQLLSMTGSALKTEEEKQAVDRVVDLCSSYGLTFKLSSVMGKYQYILDPPLDAISHFPNGPVPVVQKSKFNAFKKQDDEVQSTLNLPYNIKKMIASEVEMRKYSKPKVKSQKKEMLPPKDLASPTKFENTRNNKYCAKSSSMGTDYYVFFQFREGNSSAVRRPAKINEFL
jgi:chromosome transmission fidelity protein 18